MPLNAAHVARSAHISRSFVAAIALAIAASRGAAQATSGATADVVRLPRIFADGVVLQRGVSIPVWGWAAPRTAVVVHLDARVARAVADTAGRWSVSFPALPAGGPHTLTVDAGGRQLTVRDVLVGDVWVASGQSNMEWSLGYATGGREAVAAAHDSLLREYKIPNSWADLPAADLTGGSWAPARLPRPRNVATSATRRRTGASERRVNTVAASL